MRLTIRRFIILVFFFAEAHGQSSVNSLGFPSPNNSFLGAASSSAGVAADLYTGTAHINIPICNLSSKDLNTPVSLEYTAGKGVKVQDFATSVGLGWQLNAGGSISRVVRGFPDEFPNGYLGTGLTGKKIEDYFNAVPGATFPAGVNNGLSVPTNDGEPDIFFVRTPYFSFQFTFDGYGNPVFNNETGVKISAFNFINSGSYNYSTFIITDPNGNAYNFGSYNEKTITTLYGTSYTFITTWYLSYIGTFNNKDNVSFVYLTQSNNDQLNHYQSIRTYNYGCQDNSGSDPIPVTIVQPKYISSIVTQTGQVDFTYANDRRDITTASRLTGVTLKSKQPNGGMTTLQTYSFNSSYFGDPSNDVNLLRLRLDNIVIAGGTVGTATPVTYRSFTYNTSTNLPSRTSQNFDYWGYYKSFASYSNQDPMSDPTIRTANEANTQANILTGINELVGTKWIIAYELNSYYKTSNSTNANVGIGGLRVKTISKTLPTGENIQTSYQYNDITGKSTGKIATEAYANLVLYISSLVRVYSECPAQVYDINGNFVGYSSVKTIGQNGGYTQSDFTNFDDYPDVFDYQDPVQAQNAAAMTSAVSFAYKRGALKNETAYNAAGVKVSEDSYTFTSLNSPVTKKAWAFRWYVASASACNSSAASTINSKYNTNVENYRLLSMTHKDYDQLNALKYVQNVTSYTYCPNKRNIQTVTTTDSKGITATKTFYHVDDAGIPMLTSPEQSAITSLQQSNNINAVIHEVNNKNSSILQTHNIYNKVGNDAKPYLVSAAVYKGSNLINTNSYVYETGYSNLVTSYTNGGKAASVLYGYNGFYPVCVVSNASSYYEAQPGTGSFGNSFTTSSYSANFTSEYNGTIAWTLYPMGISGTANIYYTLSGPTSQSGSGCIGGSGCSSYYSVTLPNMPAGNYSISYYISGSYTGSGFYLTGGYPKYNSILKSEYYYEGFESLSGNPGNAHTGYRCYDATTNGYPVNFTPPNSRNYIIQWWNWMNGKWIFNEAPYTGPVSIPGVIDDIRIFPEDAQMNTYTYEPLVGKTGETGPNGRTVTYEYDGFGRVNITRDNEKNIVSKNCYNFIGQPVSCPVATVYSNVTKSGVFTRNNCLPGYTGGTVTYTVTAGTYTSTASQGDADQLAQNDVNLNGQSYANTNGSCTQIWYNVAKSGSFTRNNCGSGSTGSTVTYPVAANTYSSYISQADADQKAQNDVNNNGQAYANANGTCSSAGCSFIMASGFGTPYSSIYPGNPVSFSLVFYSTSSMYVGPVYTIATVAGGCAPSSTRSLTLTSGSNTWAVKFYSNGSVTAQIISGSTVNPNSTSYFSSSYTP